MFHECQISLNHHQHLVCYHQIIDNKQIILSKPTALQSLRSMVNSGNDKTLGAAFAIKLSPKHMSTVTKHWYHVTNRGASS